MKSTSSIPASTPEAPSRFLGLVLLPLFSASLCWAQPSILSQRYDNARTGANLAETILNTSNVNTAKFGKLFSHAVSGSTQAQLLYVPGVTIPGKGIHNVVYVVTMNDLVYAFDADNDTGSNATALWTRDFTNSAAGITAIPISDLTGSNNLNISGNVGIESTPVIDPATQTMYLLARTKESGKYLQRLHALALDTGAEKSGSPVVIKGSVPSTSTGTLTFDAKIHNQRTGLALVSGQVLIAWASHEDLGAYHGWVMAYNAATLAQSGIYCVTPTGTEGGIWQSGWAPALDASNNIYYASGNGSWNGSNNFGESVLKLTVSGGLHLADWFTPDNWQTLNNSDLDLGTSGPMLITRANLIIAGGKQSIFYIVHANALGHLKAGNGQAAQLLHVGGGELKGGPVFWDRTSGAGPWLYVWANNDFLKAFHFNGTTFDTSPVSTSTFRAPSGASGGVLALSANGDAAGSGIIWSSMPINMNGDHGVVNGMLRAFDAANLSKELWNSEQNATRDSVGRWPKFSPPLVVNGKVYSGSFSGKVSVYGLLAATPVAAAPTFNPPQGSYATSQSVTLSTTTSGATIRYTTDGSIPTSTTGTIYSAPVIVNITTTLKAIAFESGFTDSLVSSALYTIGGGASTVYQAEDGTSSSGSVLETLNAGWTGTGYVNTANAVGVWVEWTVTVPSAGNYTLDFRYANGTTANRPADLSINGSVVQAGVAFAPTAAWTTWNDVVVTKALAAGANKIRLTAAGAAGNANLDKLTVQ